MSAKILQHPALLKRAFESAGLNPALAGWISAAVPPDVDIYTGLRALRARSREAAQNDDHLRYFLELLENNVVGHQGIAVQAKPRLSTGKVDKAAAARIESAWEAQSELGTWDVTGLLSRTEFDQLGVRTAAQDGEVLIRIHEMDADSPTGFSVELIDAEALDLDYNAQLANGNVVRMGIEMSQRRRPIAYHLFRETPYLGGGYASGYSRTDRVRVPADELLHAYLPKLVWGTRGVPWAHTALRRMKMLGGYEEAAITAARAAACKSGAYEAHEWAKDYAPGNPAASKDEQGRFVQDLEPGSSEVVPFGYQLKSLDWQWPNTEHGIFIKDCLRGIACGLGVSYNLLANDLEGVNYSSLRQGTLVERDQWRKIQAWWINRVTKPIYRRWLSYAVRSGQISKGSGLSYPLDRLPALQVATFTGRSWPWVDPVKDQQANAIAVSARTRSISDVIRESGKDPEEVWDEIEADLKALSDRGIEQAQAPAAPTPAPAQRPGQEPQP